MTAIFADTGLHSGNTSPVTESPTHRSKKSLQNSADIPLSAFENAVQLIFQNGTVLSGAEAVFRALNNGLLLWCYYHLFGFANAAEVTYRFIAQHRPFFSAVTRRLWGTHPERTTFYLSRWLFLRGLGCIYLIAFLSLWVQIHGLIGSNGILPAEQLLSRCPSTNRNRRLLPTTDVVLVEPLRCLPPFPVCWRCCAVFNLNRRFLTDGYAYRFMDVLSIACDSRSSFS